MEFAPTQTKPADAGLKKERKPGEWNSHLHRQNPPTRVEERKGEWNSRLHRQNPPTRVEERKKTGRMELGCFLYTF